ncbi:MAG TPA: hypothetical protein VM166_14990 [Gemmatimonadaceae bacterium]|nr:hypothetical protein [Gemmatimonadaceae bacterium]
MSRKIILAIVLLAPFSKAAHGQDAGRAMPMPLALGPTVELSGITGVPIAWLGDAVRAAMPDAGIVALSVAPLVLQLRVSGREVGRTDAGLRSMVLVEAAVVFEVLAPGTDNVIGSSRLIRRGGGASEQSALSQALSQVAGDQQALHSALTRVGEQATHAFEVSCGDVLAGARQLAEDREYDTAIGLLLGVPSAADRCRRQAHDLAGRLYGDRAAYQCGAALKAARAFSAIGDLGSAIRSLQYVDALAPCASEVSALIAQVGSQARERRNRAAADRATYLERQYTLQRDAIKAEASLAKRRNVVVNNIAATVLLLQDQL